MRTTLSTTITVTVIVTTPSPVPCFIYSATRILEQGLSALSLQPLPSSRRSLLRAFLPRSHKQLSIMQRSDACPTSIGSMKRGLGSNGQYLPQRENATLEFTVPFRATSD